MASVDRKECLASGDKIPTRPSLASSQQKLPNPVDFWQKLLKLQRQNPLVPLGIPDFQGNESRPFASFYRRQRLRSFSSLCWSHLTCQSIGSYVPRSMS